MRVIQVNDANVFDAIIYPNQNPMNDVYIQNQFQGFSQTLTGMGMEFMAASKKLYDDIQNSMVAKMAKAVIRTAKGYFRPNDIVNLESLEEIRSANVLMQRYIMAEPTIRTKYHNQLCNGFSETYVDMEPGKVGDAHYDYRRVMDGIVRDVVIDDEDAWESITYAEDLRGVDKPLDFDEAVSIMNTWRLVKMFTDDEIDPTDIFSSD